VSGSRAVLRVTAAQFCERIVPALLEREAENGLAIGIARRLATQGDAGQDALLLAIADASDVVAAAVWTPPHDVVATRLPAGTADLLAEACAGSGWAVGGASGPDSSGFELAEALARRTHATVRVRMRHRVHELLRVEDVPQAAGRIRPATLADLDLIADWYAVFAQEVNLAHAASPIEWAGATIASGSAFLWDDGAPRSLACLSRETPNGRAIGPVYTPPAARRRGYATSLVAALSQQVLASGKRFACLFTDDANATSNHIYEAIGFRFVCRFDAYALDPLPGSSITGAPEPDAGSR
jgi:uncharacterized protein